jgi:hypothetical protein
MTTEQSMRKVVAHGLCRCGCGHLAPIATRNRRSKGWIKGEPKRYVSGHNNAKSGPLYVVEERGYRTPCWVWQRFINPDGYGIARDESGKLRTAHKWFYEKKYGPVPEGLQLDHLCRLRRCVNAEHLGIIYLTTVR